ncbi:MAG: acetate kinase, partial [Pseudomonadota bacterium]
KDPRAAEAIALYCHTIRGELAGLTAQLGGLDAVVFTGGVGENSARIRAEVCEGMDWLGLSVAAERNVAGAEFGTGPVRLLVLPTDEEQVIARATHAALLAGTGARGSS